jgi:hypothetical protein
MDNCYCLAVPGERGNYVETYEKYERQWMLGFNYRF